MTTGHDQVVAGEVRWVITVPAIWRQQAKQFMREAAYQVQFVVKSLENEKIKTKMREATYQVIVISQSCVARIFFEHMVEV